MKILVLYYSQTGQLREVLDSLVSGIKDRVAIDYVPIEPELPFPFPWQANTFFDAMPESVLQVPSNIKPLPALANTDYDLVIFGYQPWFLFPSIPSNSFLKSQWAHFLKGKKVVTVIGCRNMWLNAQEKVKAELQRVGATLVGHIVMEDKHANLVSVLTIIRWLFTGRKEAKGWLPTAGISQTDIDRTAVFGPIIEHALASNATNTLQQQLLRYGAISLRPGLIVLEKRGIGQFPKWAKRAREKGAPGAPERMGVIKTFKRLLIVAIFVLSPITDTIAKIQTALKRKKLLREVEYYKQVAYKEGMM
ncbi:MAG: hypothetical protein QM642_00875 [Edaphocola sp.]